MRPHNFYPRMPQMGGFQQFPNQMPPFQQFMPRQMPPNMIPQNLPLPKTGTPKLDSFMETANRFLSTAQNFQPLIQQATPMIRNLPALWKLYKGFQSAPNTEQAEDEDDYNYEESSHRKIPKWLEESSYEEPPKRNHYSERPRKDDQYEQSRRRDSHSSYRERDERRSSNRGPYPSVPRIFQPPYDFD